MTPDKFLIINFQLLCARTCNDNLNGLAIMYRQTKSEQFRHPRRQNQKNYNEDNK